ncbi:Aste57867_17114 [Aphanomyces stellatus]|uniref:Aste57867_17114 protein n=1 Tax=Aphanomyces stellatus TaxID=120398 RepID=A0A485L8I7_9STRA|nr:hypothetical protein As57867_017055 [Aphanomyces stellatus]VFT93872.1 Aste57867_17114 [Aphanomyces stellatus]
MAATKRKSKTTTAPPQTATATAQKPGGSTAFFGYMSMFALSLQFGLQPLLNREFAGQVQSKALMVIVCEACKLVLATMTLRMKLQREPTLLSTWTLAESLKFSGLPACTYAVQNVLIQMSMQNLTPLEFNLINQSKLIWTAVFVYLLLQRRFSFLQCVAMGMLMGASLLLSSGGGDTASVNQVDMDLRFYYGFIPVVTASVLSGLGAAMTQLSLQTQGRDTSLVTIELCVYGALFLLANMAFQPTSLSFDGWTMWTLVPAISSATGGLLVGAVTQFAGGVMKSYSLIGGIALTGVLEAVLYNKALTNDLYVASALVVSSMYMYSSYPYTPSRASDSATKKEQ